MIETERLIVRPWHDRDRDPFAAMGQDPQVMRFLGPLQPRHEADELVDRMIAMQAQTGYCFWAIERREDSMFIGFCGLKPGAAGTPIERGIEIGWRLARAYWSQGYAREAAQASLNWGWANLDCPQISAMTVMANGASWGLMERLGMQRMFDGDFDHPNLPDGHPLRRHILYTIARPTA